jgi:hypothetical protein
MSMSYRNHSDSYLSTSFVNDPINKSHFSTSYFSRLLTIKRSIINIFFMNLLPVSHKCPKSQDSLEMRVFTINNTLGQAFFWSIGVNV